MYSIDPFYRQDDGVYTSWDAFRLRFSAIAKHHYEEEPLPAHHCHQNMWIVKPSGLNCGRGIEVHNTLTSIKKFMMSAKGEYVV